MGRCRCCGTTLDGRGGCLICDATLSSPPHACLRWLDVITDEHGRVPVLRVGHPAP